MKDIVRIVIKGTSRWGWIEESFKDKVTITSEMIEYEYTPYKETEINPKRKWRYKINSLIFKMKFEVISDMVSEIIKRDITEFWTDVGGIEFSITYSDKSKFKEIYWVSSDYFEELFMVIKSLVPKCEYIPEVLRTSGDYRDSEE